MLSSIRKLPIGIQDFEDLRTNGYLYVDKTEECGLSRWIVG